MMESYAKSSDGYKPYTIPTALKVIKGGFSQSRVQNSDQEANRMGEQSVESIVNEVVQLKSEYEVSNSTFAERKSA